MRTRWSQPLVHLSRGAIVNQPVSSTPSEAQHDPAGSVRVLADGSRTLVELSGEVDAELGDDLLEVATDVGQAGLPVVVLAAGVTFMDSTGVAFLARLASRSPQRLLLVDPPELVRFLVSVTAIASLVDVVDGDDRRVVTLPGGASSPGDGARDGGSWSVGTAERAAVVDREGPMGGPEPGAGAGDGPVVWPGLTPPGPSQEG